MLLCLNLLLILVGTLLRRRAFLVFGGLGRLSQALLRHLPTPLRALLKSRH